MKIQVCCILISSLLFFGCAENRESKSSVNFVNISISNDGSRDLDWVKVDWDGPYVPGGILLKGTRSTAVDVALPDGDAASITFVDDRSREPHEVSFSLEPLKESPQSIDEVVLRILDDCKVRIDIVRK